MGAVGGTGSSRSHAALAVGVLALMAAMIVAYGVSAPTPVASANTVAAVETAPVVTDAPEPVTSEPVASPGSTDGRRGRRLAGLLGGR